MLLWRRRKSQGELLDELSYLSANVGRLVDRMDSLLNELGNDTWKMFVDREKFKVTDEKQAPQKTKKEKTEVLKPRLKIGSVSGRIMQHLYKYPTGSKDTKIAKAVQKETKIVQLVLGSLRKRGYVFKAADGNWKISAEGRKMMENRGTQK